MIIGMSELEVSSNVVLGRICVSAVGMRTGVLSFMHIITYLRPFSASGTVGFLKMEGGISSHRSHLSLGSTRSTCANLSQPSFFSFPSWSHTEIYRQHVL